MSSGLFWRSAIFFPPSAMKFRPAQLLPISGRRGPKVFAQAMPDRSKSVELTMGSACAYVRNMRLPPPLKSGSRVALVAPSGPLRADVDLERAIANTRALGWEPVVGEHVRE